MSDEYSVEEVREMAAVLLHNPKPREWKKRAGKMLAAYAERIEADERAVPVDRPRETPRRQQAVEMLLELGWTYNSERGWEEPATTAEPVTHPHSPDAADSGRVDNRMSDELRDFIEGMSVSVDVSTGETDAGNRYFGTVTEVMNDYNDKHGVTLLVQDAKPNFNAGTHSSSAAIEALRDVDHVVTQWRESGREPAYGQWLTLQDIVRAALAAQDQGADERKASPEHQTEMLMARMVLNQVVVPPASPAGVPDATWPKLELWFFRELTSAQRLALFALHGLPVDEIGESHINQKRMLRYVLAAPSQPEGAESGA